MDNLELWDSLSKTNPKYTKQFTKGGGFRGTSINPTYVAHKMTEKFGPCGVGWKYKILSEEYIKSVDGTVIHKVLLELSFKVGSEWHSVVHYGLTTFAGKNKNGVFTDEDHAKKSLTDALTKAASMIGVSADIFLGLYEDNKYINDLKEEFKEDKTEPKPKADYTKNPGQFVYPIGKNIGKTILECKADYATAEAIPGCEAAIKKFKEKGEPVPKEYAETHFYATLFVEQQIDKGLSNAKKT